MPAPARPLPLTGVRGVHLHARGALEPLILVRRGEHEAELLGGAGGPS